MRITRELFITLIVFGSLLALLFVEPIPQDLDYHNFADMRAFFGINNFFDVLSNIPFALVAISGLLFVYKNSKSTSAAKTSSAWVIFLLSILFVAVGSSYYHLNPTNETLTWDRLPMSVGFMAIFTLVLADYIHPKIETWLLVPLCILGIFSVYHWSQTDDLRLYAWVQFCTLSIVALVLFLYKPTTFRSKYLIYAFIFYALSKLTEYFDPQIYQYTQNIISGHSIKHILAAVGVYFFYQVLVHRKDCV